MKRHSNLQHIAVPVRHDQETTMHLHVVQAGQQGQPTVMLLHGFPDFWIGWRYQLALLAKEYNVLVPDLPGVGQSEAEAPSADGGIRVKQAVEHLVAILDHFQVEQAVVIGHGLGGYLAWRMCLYFPTRVRAICAIAMPYEPPATCYASLNAQLLLAPQLGFLRSLADASKLQQAYDTHRGQLLRTIFGGKLAAIRRNRVRVLTDEDNDTAEPIHTAGESDYDDTVEHIRKLRVSCTSPQQLDLLSQKELDAYMAHWDTYPLARACGYFAASMRRLNHEDERMLPRRIHHNALTILGECDGYTRAALMTSMKTYVPHGQVHVIPHAGHWVHWEHREQVNHFLLKWLQRQLITPDNRMTQAGYISARL